MLNLSKKTIVAITTIGVLTILLIGSMLELNSENKYSEKLRTINAELEVEIENLEAENESLYEYVDELQEELAKKEELKANEKVELEENTEKEKIDKEQTEEVEQEEIDTKVIKDELEDMHSRLNILSSQIKKYKESAVHPTDATEIINELNAIKSKAVAQRDKYVMEGRQDISVVYGAIIQRIDVLLEMIPCVDASEYNNLQMLEANKMADYREGIDNIN